jgi:hypothetical protein
MISNSRSILYTEIKQNQNISSKEGYWFPEHNRLLHFLFRDAKTAERLSFTTFAEWHDFIERLGIKHPELLDYLARAHPETMLRKDD